MTDEYALRLAGRWAQGYVCSLRDGEAQEYHKACAVALQERVDRERECNGCVHNEDETYLCYRCARYPHMDLYLAKTAMPEEEV